VDRLAYTYEVRELVPGERFVMSTAEGANRKDLQRLKQILE
jgi:hypothetical protein